MKRTKSNEVLKVINTSINKIAVGVFLLCLSPMIFTALCSYRIYDMSRINALGIAWVFLCILLALPLLIMGGIQIVRSYRDTKTAFEVYESESTYVERWITKSRGRSINVIIASVVVIISSALPIVTVSVLRVSNEIYVAYSYAAIFILAGAGLSMLGGAILKLWFVSRVQYRVLEGETASKEFTRKKKHKLIKKIVVVAVLIVLLVNIMSRGTWYIQPYIATIPSVAHRQLKIDFDNKSGIYTIHNKKDTEFKILQLTDIHLGGSLLSYAKDIKALEAVYQLINYTKPDLVIVTGDFVFPLGIESFSFNNYTPIMQFASFMRNIGIPWAFTYGNHDTEFVASHSEEELNQLFHSFSYETTGSLLYTNIQPDITGRSNQVILVENGDGTVNQALYLIDSNSYTSAKINDYDYIHDDQVQWYADTLEQVETQYGQDISSLIFTHIPLQEYKTAYELYKSGSEEVTYCFGNVGEKNESICCSDYKSKLFDKAVELESTKGIFVGHDHYNNISMKYKKIQLTYGMSIDYLAMPGIAKKKEQRGGTLITLHKDSTMDVEQVPLMKIEKE
ncbi:MAG: metallophosphoesterase family protein [bacterium]|nr:metallophosphoesterase family protein [bacterium]